MIDKKNTPSDTNGESKEKETLDSLAIAAFKDLVDSVQSEIKPYLSSEGEMVLANEVSVNRASIIKFNQALTTKNEAYESLLEVSRKQTKEIVKLKEENKQFKKGYEDLCMGYDNLKKLLHEISVRQGKHVGRCDKNFSGIEKALKRAGL